MVAKEEEVGEGWTGSLRLELQTIGLPWCSDRKESACSAGVPGMIPGLGRPPGEGNGSHSSILARRTPWTEGPGGLQSMGLQSQTQLSDFERETKANDYTQDG